MMTSTSSEARLSSKALHPSHFISTSHHLLTFSAHKHTKTYPHHYTPSSSSSPVSITGASSWNGEPLKSEHILFLALHYCINALERRRGVRCIISLLAKAAQLGACTWLHVGRMMENMITMIALGISSSLSFSGS
jgi:hypothetical protein